jgi:hypothetical protein
MDRRALRLVGDCLKFSILIGFPGGSVGSPALKRTRVDGSQGPAVMITGPFGGSPERISTGNRARKKSYKGKIVLDGPRGLC